LKVYDFQDHRKMKRLSILSYVIGQRPNSLDSFSKGSSVLSRLELISIFLLLHMLTGTVLGIFYGRNRNHSLNIY
jgi:hypothetical protein